MRQISSVEPMSGSITHAATPLLPLLTITHVPRRMQAGCAGMVCARAVRLLSDCRAHDDQRAKSVVDEKDARMSWWTDLRTEVIQHMRSLACNAVIGYREHLCIDDDLIIASAEGTAVLLRADTGDAALDTYMIAAIDNDYESALLPGGYSHS
jgi:hypothetical protein